jgi:hypothetical protein
MKRTVSIMFAFTAALLCSSPFFASPSNAQLAFSNADLDAPPTTMSQEATEAKVRELAARWKDTAPGAESKATLRTEITEILLQQFSEMESERMRKVEAIEKRIQSVKSILQQRAQNAERIVDDRIAQLLGEPSTMGWDFSIDLPSVSNENASEPKAESILLKHTEKLDPDLLLGYGLAESNIQGKKNELAASTSQLAEYEKMVTDAKAACIDLSRQLTGQNMNDPKLNSEYQKSIKRLIESMRQVDDITATIQRKKREIETLELQLLPLTIEVETRYQSK